jgi:hypothetical protein
VRRVCSGPISYCSLPFERVDWGDFDVIGVNLYRQSRQGLTNDQYLAKIRELKRTGKPVMITEFGFPACRDAEDPVFLGTFNATSLSLLQLHLPPRHDLDATALSLVRALPSNRRGTTYRDMGWEPKQAFHAVADYYATH